MATTRSASTNDWPLKQSFSLSGYRADGVAPVYAVPVLRHELVEKMIAPVPLAQPVGIVLAVLGRREVVQRPVRVGRQALPRFPEPSKDVVPFQSLALLLQHLRVRLPSQVLQLGYRSVHSLRFPTFTPPRAPLLASRLDQRERRAAVGLGDLDPRRERVLDLLQMGDHDDLTEVGLDQLDGLL